MIPEEELLKLGRSLLTKTQKNEVAWSQATSAKNSITRDYFDFQQGDAYVAVFRDFSYSPSSNNLEVRVNDQIVGRLSTTHLGYPDDEMLEKLVDEAQRAAIRWDVALDKLNSLFETDEVIGRPSEAATG